MGGGVEDEIFLHLAALFDLIDLTRGDVKEFEPFPGGREECVGPFGDGGEGTRPEGFHVFQGEEILLLGGDQFRAVDGQEGCSLLDLFSEKIDMEFFHPPFHLGVDMFHPLFVIIDTAHSTDLPCQWLIPDDGCFDSNILNGDGVDLDGTGIALFPFVFIDGNQIHSHGRLARFVPDVGRVHRCLPILDLPLFHLSAFGSCPRCFHLHGRGFPRMGRASEKVSSVEPRSENNQY